MSSYIGMYYIYVGATDGRNVEMIMTLRYLTAEQAHRIESVRVASQFRSSDHC